MHNSRSLTLSSRKSLDSFYPRLYYHSSLFITFLLICLLVGIGRIVFDLRNATATFASQCEHSEETRRRFASRTVEPVHKDDGLMGRQRVLGFVGIHTGFDSLARRSSIRATWLPSDRDGLSRLQNATGLAFRFVIGQTEDANKTRQLNEEIAKYNDFFVIDMEEGYLNLKYKTMVYFRSVFHLFDADFYVKLDDDIYVRPDRLATVLAKKRTNPLTYIGYMKKGSVITNPKMRWFESSADIIGNEYFLYAYGAIYALSYEIVATLTAAKNGSLRTFNNEDVTVGSWVLGMNAQYEHTPAFFERQCSATTVAVWDNINCSGLCNPEVTMKELHSMNICSKSPTLPS